MKLKTNSEINIMKECGSISTYALNEVLKHVHPGITLLELDRIAEKAIISKGGSPSFKTVDDYAFTTCINVNDGIVHGLPNNYKIKTGDLVSIDLGALYKGLHTDLSYTVEVGTLKEEKFLNVGIEALRAAIANCKPGNPMGFVSNTIQKMVEKWGYTVSRELVGHGVGHELHEDPLVPGYGKLTTGPKLQEGMTLAIEVIYQKGSPKLKIDSDGWTIKTADGSLSALFEATVAITKDGPLILTHFPML